ncbi:MAG: hypothetical protein IJC40_03245 [Muribaculaceae bacterium]|nr:hypothetical protein [Muribaculaceae bacterium]
MKKTSLLLLLFCLTLKIYGQIDTCKVYMAAVDSILKYNDSPNNSIQLYEYYVDLDKWHGRSLFEKNTKEYNYLSSNTYHSYFENSPIPDCLIEIVKSQNQITYILYFSPLEDSFLFAELIQLSPNPRRRYSNYSYAEVAGFTIGNGYVFQIDENGDIINWEESEIIYD